MCDEGLSISTRRRITIQGNLVDLKRALSAWALSGGMASRMNESAIDLPKQLLLSIIPLGKSGKTAPLCFIPLDLNRRIHSYQMDDLNFMGNAKSGSQSARLRYVKFGMNRRARALNLTISR
jgi:hypothetical protein